ncbi:MAG: GntR family transcriptional regulator [Gemmataceae bacterium]
MKPSTIVRTIREQIVDKLRHDVLTGKINVGDHLHEVELAKRFGVSRGPVRDALLQLTQEGVLLYRPNCGVQVAAAPSERVRALVLPIRRQIEAFALRIAVDEATPEEVRHWAMILEQLRLACQDNDMAAVVEHDMAFHRWIVERPNEPDLLALWLPAITRMRLVYSRHQDLNDVYPEHLKIYEALRAGDRAAAVQALEANIV